MGGALLYVLGQGLLLVLAATDLYSNTLLVGLCAGVTGIATVEMIIAWGALFSRFTLRSSLLWMSLTLGGGSVITLVLAASQLEVGSLVFMAMVVAGVITPMAYSLRQSPLVVAQGFEGEELSLSSGDAVVAQAEAAGADDTTEIESEPGTFGWTERSFIARTAAEDTYYQVFQRMATVMAVPFVGLLVFGFTTGVRKFMLFDVVYMESLGVVLGAVGAIVLSLVKTRRPLLPFLHQVILPACALVLIVLNSFPEATAPLWFAAWLSYGFYGLVALLALSSLGAMAHAGEFPPALIYGVTSVGYCAVSLLGIYCGTTPVFQIHDGGPALLVTSTFFFFFLIAMALRAGWAQEERAQTIPSSPQEETLEERCVVVAQERGLSPRETEIFSYLGRGHSVAFVAKTLVISESTVRTHVKSIYRKLEVNSKEELLQFIDEH